MDTKGVLAFLNSKEDYKKPTLEDIREIMNDLAQKALEEPPRQWVMMTGSGYEKRNRSKVTGRYEKGYHYVKGGMDMFHDKMKEEATKYLNNNE